MRSISTQITFAMVCSSIVATLIVSALSMWLVLQRFNTLAMQRAFEHFSEDVAAYIGTYGSWQRGQQTEPFTHFVMTRRRGFRDRFPPPGGPMPPPPNGMRRHPPFHFVLLNPQGIVIHAPGTFSVGSRLPDKYQKLEKPIKYNGKVVAIAVPLGRPDLSALDQSYLEAIYTALRYALIGAGIFAIAVGVLLGKGLSQSLKKLTEAIRDMKPGDLRQQVDISSRNEVGVLADAFNVMSHDLAVAYKKLENTNATIKRQARELEELSNRDELTGLHNRRYFNEHATHLFNQSKRYMRSLSIMMADIDHFKGINDEFGHHVGDKVLCVIAQLISACVRETDIVARYGGEEFVIAFPETEASAARHLCERLRKTVMDYSWEKIQDNLTVSLSIGVSQIGATETLEELLHSADEKLYQAKASGRNQVIS